MKIIKFIDPYEELAPISHNGKKFGCRLEARWDVFLNVFQWDYEYLQFYDQPSEFLLHGVKIAIPHKNAPMTMIENQDLSIMVSEEANQYLELKARVLQRCNKNVFIAGSIPSGETSKEILQNLKYMLTDQRSYGGYIEHPRTYHFYPREYIKQKMDNIEPPMSLWVDDDNDPIIGHWHSREKRGDGNVKKTLEAFEQARQARFEFEEDECNFDDNLPFYDDGIPF